MFTKLIVTLILGTLLSSVTIHLESGGPFRIHDVDIKGSDGFHMKGTLYSVKEQAPGVLLLSPCGSERWVYQDLAQNLTRVGLNVLIVDLRGHGQSPFDMHAITQEMVYNDLDSIYSFFINRDHVAPLIGIAGASCTVDFAFYLARAHPEIIALSANSGYTDSKGKQYLKENENLAFLGVASSQDEMMVKYSGNWERLNSAEAILELSESSTHKLTTTWIYDEKGHAHELFEVDPSLEAQIAAWFGKTLRN